MSATAAPAMPHPRRAPPPAATLRPDRLVANGPARPFRPPLALPAPAAPLRAPSAHAPLADLLRAAVALEAEPADWAGPLAAPPAAPVGGLDALESEAGAVRHGEGLDWLAVSAVTVARDVAVLARRGALPASADRWALLDGLALVAEGVTRG